MSRKRYISKTFAASSIGQGHPLDDLNDSLSSNVSTSGKRHHARHHSQPHTSATGTISQQYLHSMTLELHPSAGEAVRLVQ